MCVLSDGALGICVCNCVCVLSDGALGMCILSEKRGAQREEERDTHAVSERDRDRETQRAGGRRDVCIVSTC